MVGRLILADHEVLGVHRPPRAGRQAEYCVCSHLAMRGANPKTIQELAGHADLSTTMRYMHLAEGQKEQAIRLLDRRPTATQVASVEAGLEAVKG